MAHSDIYVRSEADVAGVAINVKRTRAINTHNAQNNSVITVITDFEMVVDFGRFSAKKFDRLKSTKSKLIEYMSCEGPLVINIMLFFHQTKQTHLGH